MIDQSGGRGDGAALFQLGEGGGEGLELFGRITAVLAGVVAILGADGRFVGPGHGDLVEEGPGASAIGAAVEDAEIHGPAHDVTSALRGVIGAGPVGGGGLADEAAVGIESVEFIVDAFNEDFAVIDIAALVAGAPEHDAGAVIVTEDHLAPHLFVDMTLIVLDLPGLGVVVPPDRDLLHDAEAEAVGVEVGGEVIGIVGRADELAFDARFYHLQILQDLARRHAAAIVGVVFMACHRRIKDRFVVDQHLVAVGVQGADAELGMVLVDDAAVLAHGDAQDVKIWRFRCPQRRVGDLQSTLPDTAIIDRDLKGGLGLAAEGGGAANEVGGLFTADVGAGHLRLENLELNGRILGGLAAIFQNGANEQFATPAFRYSLGAQDMQRVAHLDVHVMDDAGVVKPVDFDEGDDILARPPFGIVDAYGQGIAGAIIEVLGDIKSKWRKAAFVIAEVLAVEPNVGDIVYSIKDQL